jgi:hypothetical protein
MKKKNESKRVFHRGKNEISSNIFILMMIFIRVFKSREMNSTPCNEGEERVGTWKRVRESAGRREGEETRGEELNIIGTN